MKKKPLKLQPLKPNDVNVEEEEAGRRISESIMSRVSGVTNNGNMKGL